jgi:AcrR family transcriptional regulator
MSSEAPTPTWREVAVARSLDPARARAESRVQRYLDAAIELLNNEGGDFTVQEVVERSGQSLRGFYQYFTGKHELLLAVFEESVRWTAEHLEQTITGEKDPYDRLRRFAIEYYILCAPNAGASAGAGAKARAPKKRVPMMAEFAQQLLTAHPKEAARAFVPLTTLLDRLLDDAIKTGDVRRGLEWSRVTGVMLQTIMFHSFATTISGKPPGNVQQEAQLLWDLIYAGIGPPRRR